MALQDACAGVTPTEVKLSSRSLKCRMCGVRGEAILCPGVCFTRFMEMGHVLNARARYLARESAGEAPTRPPNPGRRGPRPKRSIWTVYREVERTIRDARKLFHDEPAFVQQLLLGKNSFRGTDMRSKWEVDFATLCCHLRLTWKYEPRTFVLDDGSRYTPDFYVTTPLGPCYVELHAMDGAWVDDGASADKRRRAVSQILAQTGIPLVILDERAVTAIQRRVRREVG